MKKVLILLSAVIFASTMAFANNMKNNRYDYDGVKMVYGGFERGFDKFKGDLNLTDRQKTSIDAIEKAHKEKQKMVMDQIKMLKKEVKSALDKKDYDAAKKITRDIANLQGDMESNSIDYRKSVQDILTKNQNDSLNRMIENAKNEKKEKRMKKEMKK